MTAEALELIDALLCEAADYAATTGEPATAQLLRLAAAAARRLAVREHAA